MSRGGEMGGEKSCGDHGSQTSPGATQTCPTAIQPHMSTSRGETTELTTTAPCAGCWNWQALNGDGKRVSMFHAKQTEIYLLGSGSLGQCWEDIRGGTQVQWTNRAGRLSVLGMGRGAWQAHAANLLFLSSPPLRLGETFAAPPPGVSGCAKISWGPHGH